MKPEVIRDIARQATAKASPLRIVLTNGKSFTVPGEDFLWITDDLLGIAHSANPQTGLPRNPTFLDPKEVAEVEIVKRKASKTSA